MQREVSENWWVISSRDSNLYKSKLTIQSKYVITLLRNLRNFSMLTPDSLAVPHSSCRSDADKGGCNGKQSPPAKVSGAGVDSSCRQASGGSIGWRTSLEAVADVAVEKATKATESSADWLRKVGLRDGENDPPRPQQDGEVSRLPQPLEGIGRGVMVEAGEETSQLPTTTAAAAAAARRWESKLKGSFASMTSGVRWGMT